METNSHLNLKADIIELIKNGFSTSYIKAKYQMDNIDILIEKSRIYLIKGIAY